MPHRFLGVIPVPPDTAEGALCILIDEELASNTLFKNIKVLKYI